MREMLPQVIKLEQVLDRLTKSNDRDFAESLIKQARRYANEETNKALTANQLYYVEKMTRVALGTSRAGRTQTRRTPTSAPTSTASVDIESIVEKVLERVPGFDSEQVTEQVLGMSDALSVEIVAKAIKALDARLPVKTTIEVKRDGQTHAVEGAQHPKFEQLLRAATCRLANGYSPGIFLAGEASSGKTTGCKHLAKALKLDWHFNGAISFPHEMLGFIDGNGKYHRTPFRDAYEHGGVYTFDEVDRSDPVALLAVNPHLANGVATFPDKQITRHKDCIIVCTANTWGLGADSNYSGATKLDAAFLSRFPIRINWDIDIDLETTIVSHPEWLKKVRDARARARTAGLKVMIDVRAAQAGAALIAAGFSLQDAANMTYLANLKPEQRSQLGG